MAERYKLPDGSERENGQRYDVIGVGITLIGFTIDGAVQWFPESMLTPVKPPTPPEPEPGAYIIGGHLAVLFPSISNWICEAGDEDGQYWDWEPLWRVIGGPDVTITRLVPERVETVELPYVDGDVEVDRAIGCGCHGQEDGVSLIRIGVADSSVCLEREPAGAFARAILAASRAES